MTKVAARNIYVLQKMNKLSLTASARTVAGAVFLVSGLAKALDADYFGSILVAYGADLLYYAAPPIVFTELLLGLALVFGVRPKLTATAAIAMVVVFTAVYTYGAIFIDIKNCGCFGRIPLLDTSPTITYIRNILLISALLVVAKSKHKSSADISPELLTVCMLMMFSGAFICGNTLRYPDRTGKADHFKPIAVSEHVLSKFVKTSPDSTYLVTIFSYTCPHCINSVGNIEQYERLGVVDKIIGLAVDNPDEERRFKEIFRPSFEIRNYPIEELAELSVEFPVSFMVQRDSVRWIIPGELPSAYFLKVR